VAFALKGFPQHPCRRFSVGMSWPLVVNSKDGCLQ